MTGVRAGSATDVGLVRSNNQDQLLVVDGLFAVADGMGGAAAGEVASATAIEGLRAAFAAAADPTPETLVESAEAANRAVWERAEANPEMRGMGTTLVALAVVTDGRLAAVNVGDSRLYAFQDEHLRQVTEDHSLVAELVAEGRLSKEEAELHPRRNIMTRALGVDPEVPVDLFMLDTSPGDRFVLCSDGLIRELSDDQIAAILRRLADPADAAKELVEEAKHRGGTDNITVVVVDVVDEDKEPPAAAAIPATAPDSAAPEREVEGDAAPDLTTAHPVVVAAPKPPKRRLLTLRVVLFTLGILALLALAAAGTAWYARDGYFVGLRGDQITIFQGRPGGVLWFKPTVAEPTTITTSDIESHNLQNLQAGQVEPSLNAAREYVQGLVAEEQQAQAALRPPPSTTTTTRPRRAR